MAAIPTEDSWDRGHYGAPPSLDLQVTISPRLFVDLRPVICPWCGTAANAERPLFGKAAMAARPLSSISLHASLNIQHAWFGKAAMAARPLSKYLSSGSSPRCVGSFEGIAAIAVRPPPWTHPVPSDISWLIFQHRTDSLSG